jgi:hypothetical protein
MGTDPSTLRVGPCELFYAAAAARDGTASERAIQHEIISLYDQLAERMARGPRPGSSPPV